MLAAIFERPEEVSTSASAHEAEISAKMRFRFSKYVSETPPEISLNPVTRTLPVLSPISQVP